MFTATTSRRIGLVLMLAVTAMAALAACSPVGGSPSIVAMVWLPGGDIVYRQVDFDGNVSMLRRNGAGETTAMPTAAADAAAGPGCTSTEPGLFAAPSGDLGLAYDCTDSTQLVDVAGSGIRKIASLPAGWGNFSLVGSESVDGLAMIADQHVPDGFCSGIGRIQDGRLGGSIPAVDWQGHLYQVSPPLAADCANGPDAVGVWQPRSRRDGTFVTFVMRTREADGTIADRLWWWPVGASAPRQVGPVLSGVDNVAIDPQSERVAISLGLGSGGVQILDLKSGSVRWVSHRSASQVQFAPDGRSVAYVLDNDRLVIDNVGS